MIDREQMQLLIYNHAVQLTLIDHGVEEAFAIAHRTAALGFNDRFTQDGLAAAAQVHDASSASNAPALTGGAGQGA